VGVWVRSTDPHAMLALARSEVERNREMVERSSRGTYRVGLDFNPSGSERVRQIKEKAAEMIDLIDEIGANRPSGEVARLKALAQTAIEEAAMWAVKAATKPEDRSGDST